jgi:hypothetical protein
MAAKSPQVRTIRPNSTPQETFLSSPADIAVYGGSAGGGKTWAELLEPLRHIGNPNFGAVIFRRTSPQITNEGGLWDAAGKIYPLIGGRARIGDLEWVFPSGARVTFKHLQHEATKYHWQGSEIPLIQFDELTHFSESQFWYMASRNRSTCGVRPYIRGTCNADASSWVKRLCAPWVDRKFPDPAKSGEIRWLVRKDGKYHWFRSREAAREEHPSIDPKSVTFVRATLWDNVDLLRSDPGYLANLQAQDTVEQARLLYGDWDVVNDGLVYPDFGTIVVEPEEWPKGLVGTETGGIDWGWNNPFGAVASKVVDDVMWVWYQRHGSRITLSEHSDALPRDGQRWWADPAGADQIAELRRAGHDVVPCVHTGTKPLPSGIAKVTQRIKTGRLKVHGSLGYLIEEAGKYHYEKQTEVPVDADNHLLAALRYMIVGHDRGKPASPQPAGNAAVRDFKREQAKAEALKKRMDAHYDPDNDHWWGGG